jgi:hypothetical protein
MQSEVTRQWGDLMRTTLTIDDDILEAARERADFERKTVGEVLSALARKGLCPPQPVQTFRNGVPLLPIQPGAKSATLELIKELMDETP